MLSLMSNHPFLPHDARPARDPQGRPVSHTAIPPIQSPEEYQRVEYPPTGEASATTSPSAHQAVQQPVWPPQDHQDYFQYTPSRYYHPQQGEPLPTHQGRALSTSSSPPLAYAPQAQYYYYHQAKQVELQQASSLGSASAQPIQPQQGQPGVASSSQNPQNLAGIPSIQPQPLAGTYQPYGQPPTGYAPQSQYVYYQNGGYPGMVHPSGGNIAGPSLGQPHYAPGALPGIGQPLPKRKSKQSTTWSSKEDKLLRELKEVQKLGWREISTFFQDRTPNACQFRWRRIISGTSTGTSIHTLHLQGSDKLKKKSHHSINFLLN